MFIVQTFHLILDHFKAFKITAHFFYPLTLLFPLMHFAKSTTYNKYTSYPFWIPFETNITAFCEQGVLIVLR